MPATYEPIATTTLGADAATITFSSIPATYTDLRVVLVGRNDVIGDTTAIPILRFNSDTGSNYSRTLLNGTGAAAQSSRNTSATSINCGAIAGGISADKRGLVEVDIFSYAGSTNKTCLVSNSNDLNTGDTSSQVRRIVGLWRDTTAINAISFALSDGADFAATTSVTLYGILKA